MTRERKPRAKKGKKKVKAPFRYSKGGPDPYHNLLNFIQTQAHNNQVDELIKQVNQANAFAKRARAQALDEVYADVREMEVDRPGQFSLPQAPIPPARTDTPMTRPSPAIGDMNEALKHFMARKNKEKYEQKAAATREEAARLKREQPQSMEGITNVPDEVQRIESATAGPSSSRSRSRVSPARVLHTVEPAVAREILRHDTELASAVRHVGSQARTTTHRSRSSQTRPAHTLESGVQTTNTHMLNSGAQTNHTGPLRGSVVQGTSQTDFAFLASGTPPPAGRSTTHKGELLTNVNPSLREYADFHTARRPEKAAPHFSDARAAALNAARLRNATGVDLNRRPYGGGGDTTLRRRTAV